jgi:hypothetical protein
MAWTIPGFTFSRVAGADLSALQYYYVKLSTTDTVVVCAAATDVPIGVLQNAPTSGQAAEIMVTGITKVNSNAALSIGNLIGTAADGQADAKTAGSDTTEYVVGVVLEASGAAGELATATVNCLNPHRAA